MTPAAFKRSIRDLQVWCSSCMVAFSGSDPIGVLIGAKRPSGTLVHKIAVHPDHRAPGSWPSPARVARLEARDSRSAANRRRSPRDARRRLRAVQRKRVCPGSAPDRLRPGPAWQQSERGRRPGRVRRVRDPCHGRRSRRQWPPWRGHPQVCWERSVETLTARKDDIAGLAVASDERIEAYVLYVKEGEIVSLRSFVDDGGARLKQLLSRLRAEGWDPSGSRRSTRRRSQRSCWRRSVSSPAGGHRLYAASAGRVASTRSLSRNRHEPAPERTAKTSGKARRPRI